MTPSEQRAEALILANATRTKHAQIKRQVAAGELDPVEVLTEANVSMKVIDLLLAIPWVGRTKAMRMLHKSCIPHTLRVNQLVGARHEVLIQEVGWTVQQMEANRARKVAA